jgi:hypothetical protein
MNDESLMCWRLREMKTCSEQISVQVHTYSSTDTSVGPMELSQRPALPCSRLPLLVKRRPAQFGQLGAQMARGSLSIQPTVMIPVGYRFNVRINGDIVPDSRRTVGGTWVQHNCSAAAEDRPITGIGMMNFVSLETPPKLELCCAVMYIRHSSWARDAKTCSP